MMDEGSKGLPVELWEAIFAYLDPPCMVPGDGCDSHLLLRTLHHHYHHHLTFDSPFDPIGRSAFDHVRQLNGNHNNTFPTSGRYAFLFTVPLVCRRWHAVSTLPRFWNALDLTRYRVPAHCALSHARRHPLNTPEHTQRDVQQIPSAHVWAVAGWGLTGFVAVAQFLSDPRFRELRVIVFPVLTIGGMEGEPAEDEFGEAFIEMLRPFGQTLEAVLHPWCSWPLSSKSVPLIASALPHLRLLGVRVSDYKGDCISYLPESIEEIILDNHSALDLIRVHQRLPHLILTELYLPILSWVLRKRNYRQPPQQKLPQHDDQVTAVVEPVVPSSTSELFWQHIMREEGKPFDDSVLGQLAVWASDPEVLKIRDMERMPTVTLSSYLGSIHRLTTLELNSTNATSETVRIALLANPGLTDLGVRPWAYIEITPAGPEYMDVSDMFDTETGHQVEASQLRRLYLDACVCTRAIHPLAFPRLERLHVADVKPDMVIQNLVQHCHALQHLVVDQVSQDLRALGTWCPNLVSLRLKFEETTEDWSTAMIAPTLRTIGERCRLLQHIDLSDAGEQGVLSDDDVAALLEGMHRAGGGAVALKHLLLSSHPKLSAKTLDHIQKYCCGTTPHHLSMLSIDGSCPESPAALLSLLMACPRLSSVSLHKPTLTFEQLMEWLEEPEPDVIRTQRRRHLRELRIDSLFLTPAMATTAARSLSSDQTLRLAVCLPHVELAQIGDMHRFTFRRHQFRVLYPLLT
eukprot:TRINITY_DN2008_c2_g1_i1.p1 TRINITY_DN2008_c2_g1~~TRINITY_DN2008_c2_g1_i1.p1  ORF type:complete len:744 (+),score=91.85 TRINITY_DN2008_c2_g1_i1:29-2260(+)